MISPLKLLKLAKNVGSPAELLDIFGEMGIRIQVQQIGDVGREGAFCELAEMAMAPGHQVVMLRAGEPGGPRVKAILVLETDDSTPRGQARSGFGREIHRAVTSLPSATKLGLDPSSI